MPASKAQQKAVAKYENENYDKFLLRFLEKGEKSQVQEHAKSRDESLNGFVNRAIKEALERDRNPDAKEPVKKKRPVVKKAGAASGDAFDLGDELNRRLKEHLKESGESPAAFFRRAAHETMYLDGETGYQITDAYREFAKKHGYVLEGRTAEDE